MRVPSLLFSKQPNAIFAMDNSWNEFHEAIARTLQPSEWPTKFCNG
jgi:hypothetical protein